MLSGTLPAAVRSGASGRVSVRVSRLTPGPVTAFVSLYASSDAQLDADDTPVLAAPAVTKVAAGKAKTVKLTFTYPAADGPVYLLARASSAAEPPGIQGATDDVAAAAAPVTVAPANAVLNPTSLVVSSASLVRGKRGAATLLVTNEGNVPYQGMVAVSLAASGDDDTVGDDVMLTTLSKRLNVKPGATKRIRIRFALPTDFALSSFRIVASVAPAAVVGVSVTGGAIVGTQAVAVTA